MTALDYLQSAWSSNPFTNDVARANSNYSGYASGDVVRLLERAPVTPFARVAHDAFRTMATSRSVLPAKRFFAWPTLVFNAAFELARREELHVVDPLGERVADLLAFDRSDRWIVLSSGRTIDYANTIYFTQGHVLYCKSQHAIVHDRLR